MLEVTYCRSWANLVWGGRKLRMSNLMNKSSKRHKLELGDLVWLLLCSNSMSLGGPTSTLPRV